FFRELRLNRLVSPIAGPTHGAWAGWADVLLRRPAVLEASLKDDVRAFAHRGERFVESGRTFLVDLDDALARSRKALDVRALVNQTTLAKDLEHRVVEERPPREPVRPQPLERHEMPARKQVAEGCGPYAFLAAKSASWHRCQSDSGQPVDFPRA